MGLGNLDRLESLGAQASCLHGISLERGRQDACAPTTTLLVMQ
jgi:hypothetical protein